MANPLSPFEKAGLLYVAGYIEQHKDQYAAAAVGYADKGLDEAVAAIKKAEPHAGLLALGDAALNVLLDNLDAEAKAAAPTEAGALIDYVVAKLNDLAASIV